MDAFTVFQGVPQTADPSNLEPQIRAMHHVLVDAYINKHFDFLLGLGLYPADCAILRDIASSHRHKELDQVHGLARPLGALLRLVDELDISPSRAPASVLLSLFNEMDATSCWHWFKHSICQDWRLGHNVVIEAGKVPSVTLKLAVHPPKPNSIPYWLTQVSLPITRILQDEGVARIIAETFGIQINLTRSQEMSSALSLGSPWDQIEHKSLSANRKVILVIDDEVRKMEDLFLPLMQTYHVMFSPDAKDALEKLAAARADLAIVDLQIGSGSLWSPEETQDFKMTGVKLCREIHQRCPKTKIGILTGSHHDLSLAQELKDIQFLLRKPISPDEFEKEVRGVLA